jgi:tRNA pseudouridine13 synthase
MPVPSPIDVPLVTDGLPGVGGRLKVELADFEVEEIPAYEPAGSGPFLYLWIEKRDMGAEYFVRQLARRLGLRPDDIGMAGLKDRRAVTRQWVSVPATVEDRVNQIDGDGLALLEVSRHTNKLRAGHLRGNRFRIRVRDVEPQAPTRLQALLEKLKTHGLPNYYGPQRFGRGGANWAQGLALLRGEQPAEASWQKGKLLRKLTLSAAQSGFFNLALARRLLDGLFRTVLPGDVMAKWPFGGLFTAEDVATEQTRFDRREIVTAGPIFGRKMFPARGVAAQREAAVLECVGVPPEAFHRFGKLLPGTRRHNLVYVEDLTASFEGPHLLHSFTLPAGSYATVLLRELMKTEEAAEDGPEE